MVLRPLLINHRPTQKFNVLWPDLEAKARAAHRRGQGHKILSSRSRPVLEDPIPGYRSRIVSSVVLSAVHISSLVFSEKVCMLVAMGMSMYKFIVLHTGYIAEVYQYDSTACQVD